MKKALARIIVVILTAALLILPSHAYDYREDKLTETEWISDQAVLDEVAGMGGSAAPGDETAVRFDDAVKVYRFEWEDFVGNLKSNTLGRQLETHDWTVWIAPISGYEEGRAVVFFGEDSFSTAKSNDPREELTFLHSPEVIEQALASQTYDSVYLTEIPQWYIYFVTLLSGDEVKLMPYASRPEFMVLENGVWYSADEMTAILETFAEDTSSGGGMNGGVGIWWYELLPIVAVPAAIIALIVILLVRRSRKKQ